MLDRGLTAAIYLAGEEEEKQMSEDPDPVISEVWSNMEILDTGFTTCYDMVTLV